MLTDNEEDFFFEEDKISLLQNKEDKCTDFALVQLEDEVNKSPHSNQLNSSVSTLMGADNEVEESKADSTTVVCMAHYVGRRLNYQKVELERLGMTVSTASVVITKDQSNLIGISIGGGAPLCPCLYIVQVFDGTPASKEGSLESGDELLGINSESVKGKTKVEVAKMIQSSGNEVRIHYNKLHADPEQGKSLDIILKKIKHRFVDSMSSNTADTLGLSRAILCNDSLVKRLEELEGTEMMYKGLVEHANRMLKAYFDLFVTFKSFGDVFAAISVREPKQRASEAFRLFSELHRNMEKDGMKMLKEIKPVLNDLGTYLNKAIPDTKMTVRKYTDAKFAYLSYCLKVKEMDDEEHGAAALQEALYRVETGNYEYRLILRCRQDARTKFAKLRSDVLEKMELLECKHATDLTKQLRCLLDSLGNANKAIVNRIEAMPTLFPIEVDFKETDFEYKSPVLSPQEEDDDIEEVTCGLEAVELPAKVIDVDDDNIPSTSSKALKTTECTSSYNNDDLLRELGLIGIDLNAGRQPQFTADLLLQ